MQVSDLTVVHNTDKRRFEVRIDSHVAELTYMTHTDVIIFTHTGVPSELEGRGIGSRLVRAGLQYARENKLKVQSLCWFVNGYFDRHPEYKDLLA